MRDDHDDARDRRRRILDGARAAFLRFGFERASMADIAAGAGVSRTALYHYFPGKEEVLRAVVDEGAGALRKSLSDAAGKRDASQPAKRRKPKKAAFGQREMLMAIAGKGEDKAKPAAKETKRPTRQRKAS